MRRRPNCLVTEKKYEDALMTERAEIIGILTFKKVFVTLKNVLDNVHSVTVEKY